MSYKLILFLLEPFADAFNFMFKLFQESFRRIKHHIISNLPDFVWVIKIKQDCITNSIIEILLSIIVKRNDLVHFFNDYFILHVDENSTDVGDQLGKLTDYWNIL